MTLLKMLQKTLSNKTVAMSCEFALWDSLAKYWCGNMKLGKSPDQMLEYYMYYFGNSR